MTELSGTCWKCGRGLSGSEYARSESCSGCDSDTRCCRNCLFYDPKLNNECRESRADPVVEKGRATFCEFFKPGSPKPGSPSPSKEPGRTAFDALFKKKKD